LGNYRTGAPNDSFREISVKEGLTSTRYSDLIPLKTRGFFGETSPRSECKITSASIFGEPSAARQFGR